MMYGGFDIMFNILFPLMFLCVFGIILYTIISNILTWNKNNHSPRLTVPATVVAKRMEVTHHHNNGTNNMGGMTTTHTSIMRPFRWRAATGWSCASTARITECWWKAMPES